MKKIFFTICLLFLLILMPGSVNADSNINGLFSDGQQDFVGLNCGFPYQDDIETPFQDLKSNRCCSIKTSTDNLQAQAVNNIPEFFCLPTALSAPLRVGGGLLKDIADVTTAPLKLLKEAVTGNFKNIKKEAFDSLPDNLIRSVAHIGDKVCLSDAPKLFTVSVLGVLPFNKIKNINLPTQQCIEGAAPKYEGAACACVPDTIGAGDLCKRYIDKPSENINCMRCVGKRGIYTGMGCVGTDLPGLVGSLTGFGMGLAGGLALLCIIYSAFLLQTSRGNPDKIKKAREYLTNCIMGLIIIVFSIFILKVIGVDILGIPGFGK